MLFTSAPSAAGAWRPSPVLLVPGFGAWGEMESFHRYFTGLREALQSAGADVYDAVPSPIASSAERGQQLLDSIARVRHLTGAQKVAIIAHSQGGVDVRWALAHGGAEQVSVVATLSSPHEGSDLADAFRDWVPSFVTSAGLIAFQWTWESEQRIAHRDADPVGSLYSLSRVGMREFNAAAANQTTHGVHFFSLGAVAGDDIDGSCAHGRWGLPAKTDVLHPVFVPAHWLIRLKGGAESDDGVVPSNSMRFGHWLGCIPADHVDWMGWQFDWDGGDVVRFDERAFLVELWRGMRDVERANDARAMDAHIPALAALAHAPVASESRSSTVVNARERVRSGR
jgi:pimeloyl-ACP methyl ester carboxylesterase